MNEAHGQNYNAEQYLGGIDVEEVRVIAYDALRSLRSIAKSLHDLSAAVSTDNLGRAAVRVEGEFIGGDGDVEVGA